ncbi:PilN domain-containing protein [Aliidiomarina halalkaliphila]|uniref:PilN domain-containing protein n=1 Tax=Aliidiomarina halalkaliphila TaxID=2593535 RepID=A0A552X644_9GAMM|nr:PilN domain-containing protein [Aliidiomarina halalkaliphila]TRW50472.1 PilN domain-containing protein [Aliidiomarina halalkaliphila]
MKPGLKQTVNLYRADLQPRQVLLTFDRLVITLVLVFILMLGWRVVLEVQQSAFSDRIEAARTEQLQKQAEMTRLAEQVRDMRPRTDLTREVQRLETEVQLRQSLLAEMRRRGQLRRHDFAGLLTDLARHHQDGIWLTRIQQSQNQLILTGQSTDPAILPYWLSGFRQSNTLSRRHFSMVELRRDDRDVLRFVLQSSGTGIAPEYVPQTPEDDSADTMNDQAQAQESPETDSEEADLEEALRRIGTGGGE